LLLHARPGESVSPPFDLPSARMLVPLDGSSLSEAAVPVAATMVGMAGELVLLMVVEPPERVHRDDSGRVIAYVDQQETTVRQTAFDYLDGVAATVKKDNPDLHITSDVRVGAPAEGIIFAEVDRAADLVVMATHGRTGVDRVIRGSVAGDVVRDGHAPVLLVPPHVVAPQPVSV